MNNVVTTAMGFFVFGHRCLLTLVGISTRILQSHEPWDKHTCTESDIWHNSIDNHCLNYLFTNNLIPCGHVIEEQTTLNKLTKCAVLRHVCIDKHKQYTRVEKLRNKDTVCNRSKALTVCIMFNRLN